MRTPSQFAAERIRVLRKHHGWTQQQLADRFGQLGSPIDRVAIAKTETGKRGLSLDEALLFALALDVAPIHLFLPIEHEDVQLAPTTVVPPLAARRWAAGIRPLDGTDWRPYFSEVPKGDWVAREALVARQDTEDLSRAQREYRESVEPHRREGELLGDTERRLTFAEENLRLEDKP